MWAAVRYLSDAIHRMTGARPATVGGHDYPATNAIVLTTLSALEQANNVPDDLLAKAKQALAVQRRAALHANEAYYIHTESNAVYVVANQMQGLPHGVVELLLGDNAVSPQYQIGYEKLGMGPNWTYVPDFTRKPLVFNMEYAGRPGLFCRGLGPTRGEFPAPPAPPSPTRPSGTRSRRGCLRRTSRWSSATSTGRWDSVLTAGRRRGPCRVRTLEHFGPTVAANMLATGSDKGFLCVTKLGLDAARPPATPEYAGLAVAEHRQAPVQQGQDFPLHTARASTNPTGRTVRRAPPLP